MDDTSPGTAATEEIFSATCSGTLLGTILPDLRPLIISYWIAKSREKPFLKQQYEFLRDFGTYGERPGEFSAPKCIAINPVNQDIWIADCYNNRIQIFKKDWTFVKCIGEWRGILKRLEAPASLVFDLDGTTNLPHHS